MLSIFFKMDKICFLVFVFCIHHASGYYRLTDEQFAMMPPLVHTDRFSHCVNRPGGLYCTTYANLVADEPNSLLDMMQNYTMSSVRHYNYSEILYGLCMTDTCKHHLRGNSTPELMRAAEACLNETLKKKYDLGAQVEKLNCYGYKEQKHQKDYIDNIVFNVLYAIVVLNIVATAYDFFFNKDNEEGWIVSFSMIANWKKMTAPPSKDPRNIKLIGINGIRALTMILIMLGHAPIPPLMAIENPQWLEGALENVLLQSLFQGHVITQTFLLISGFLLTYHMKTISDNKLSWTMIPQRGFLRWLRLAPVNIAILALSATSLKFTNYGPFWQENIGAAIHDCRENWLSVVFYYNNYVGSTCNLENWSVGCDIHLHIIGLLIIVLSPNETFRKRVIKICFLIGVILPALEIYFRDLDGNLLVVAHAIRSYLVHVPTFKYLYVRTHTNMPAFFLGMYLGYTIEEYEKIKIHPKIKKVLNVALWTTFPWILFITASSYLLFLGDGPRAPIWMRILFVFIQKPIFAILMAALLISLFIKLEDIRLYSWILESPALVPFARMSYSMFAIHLIVIRYLGGTKSTITYVSFIHTMQEYLGVVVLTTALGLLLYLMIESPFSETFKLLFFGRKSKVSLKAKDNTNGVYTNGNYIQANGKFREEYTNIKPIKTE